MSFLTSFTPTTDELNFQSKIDITFGELDRRSNRHGYYEIFSRTDMISYVSLFVLVFSHES